MTAPLVKNRSGPNIHTREANVLRMNSCSTGYLPRKNKLSTPTLFDCDSLHIAKFHHAKIRALTAKTRGLCATKRQRWVRADKVVYEAHPGIEFRNGNLRSLLEIFSEYSSAQSKL